MERLRAGLVLKQPQRRLTFSASLDIRIELGQRLVPAADVSRQRTHPAQCLIPLMSHHAKAPAG
ncbi:hypothetical protein V461_01095 [Pantoea ananatis BRT98]|nr:hypothetical protein V461_01095 [Pantoea ananatis BRT98]